MRAHHHILILVIVSLFLFLYGSGNMALTDPDETFYAETAKEMLGNGEWLTPLIFGEPQFEKPVFFYWIVRISYNLFGVNEFAARLPSAVFALAGIIAIYALGRLIFSPICGLLAGLIMASSIEYIVLARACVTDMVLTVSILLSLLFFLAAWAGKGRGYCLLSAAMAAVAVLTKGPVGLFIPGLIIALYLLTGKRWRGIKRLPVFGSALVFLLISVPWYFLVIQAHGGEFINEFLGFHNITRFLEPEHRIGSSPFFYLPVLIGGFFPWSVFLPAAAWSLCRKDAFVSKVDAHKLFLVLWFVVIFGFFSVSRTKLVTYIFPLFPVVALTTARLWEKAISCAVRNRVIERFTGISFYLYVCLSLAGLTGACLLMRRNYSEGAIPMVLSGAVFLAGMVLSIFLFARGKRAPVFFSIVLTVMVFMVPFVKLVLPVVEKYQSSRELAGIMGRAAGREEAVAGEGDHRGGVAFYSGRADIEDVHPYNDLIKFVSRDKRSWCVIQRKHYDQLRAQKKDLYLEVVAGSGKYVLITNKPYDTAGL